MNDNEFQAAFRALDKALTGDGSGHIPDLDRLFLDGEPRVLSDGRSWVNFRRGLGRVILSPPPDSTEAVRAEWADAHNERGELERVLLAELFNDDLP